MTRLMITSDLHLGHKNIHNFRPFSSAEAHHEDIYEKLCMSINKRDSVIFLGDIAFDKYWLGKIGEIKCDKKLLVCGNHDTENSIKMRDLVNVYDDVVSLFSRRNYWFSHCPIHPSQMRGKVGNIHGHLHDKIVWRSGALGGLVEVKDSRYINACVEHTDWKPVTFEELIKRNSI